MGMAAMALQAMHHNRGAHKSNLQFLVSSDFLYVVRHVTAPACSMCLSLSPSVPRTKISDPPLLLGMYVHPLFDSFPVKRVGKRWTGTQMHKENYVASFFLILVSSCTIFPMIWPKEMHFFMINYFSYYASKSEFSDGKVNDTMKHGY